MYRLTPVAALLAVAVTILSTEAMALPTDPVTEKIGRWCEGPDPPIAYKEEICARLHRAKEERRAARLAAAQVEVAPVAPPAYTTVAPAPVSTGGCPSYMSGEATSPTAVNPTSGASGCYQVLPSTAAAIGPACADVNAQSCVDAICAAQGNAAWSSSGATPCG